MIDDHLSTFQMGKANAESSDIRFAMQFNYN